MATLSDCLNELYILKNLVKLTIDACIQSRTDIFRKTTSDLNGLDDAITEIRFAIYHPKFRNTENKEKLLLEIDSITKDAVSKVQDLTVGPLTQFGHARREAGQRRAEKAVDLQRLDDLRGEFVRITRSYRRIFAALSSREDRDKLAPRSSSSSNKQQPRDRSMPPPSRPASFLSAAGPSTSTKGSISVPPSPFQPSIEDVEDDPEEEPRNVQSYHLGPEEAVTLDGSDKGKQAAQPVLPQVFIRAPTELTEAMIPSSPSMGNETSKLPLKSAMKKSPASSGGSSQSPSPRSRADSSPRGELMQASTSTSTATSLEDQIKQLQAELASVRASDDKLAQPHPMMRSASTRSNRSNRLSVDFDSRPTLMEPPKTSSRPRASTTTSVGADRPSAMRTGSESYIRRRTPRQSPREPSLDYQYTGPSPQAIPRPYPSPRLPQSPSMQQDGFGFPSQFQPGSYGQEHRTSLSTVLEQQTSADSSRRTPRPSPRFSGTFDDFDADDGNGDFELFGPASQDQWMSPRERGPRTPRLSRDDSWTPIIEHSLDVTLENLYTGANLKAHISRKVIDASMTRYTQQEHAITIPISRGLKAGSIIKFKGAGDVTPAGSQDIHFVVKEAPHHMFTRSGNDLHTTLEIPLLESLLGWERTIPTICGKKIRLSSKGPTAPNWKHCLPGLGMVQKKNVDSRGDLIVAIAVKYPTSISDRQKRLILDAFGERS